MSESSSTARKRSRATLSSPSLTTTSSSGATSGSNYSHTNASLDMLTKKLKSHSSPSSTATPTSHTIQQLTIEISHLKTELTKQKSLYSINEMKSNNTIQRLQRFISSLQEDVSSANELIDVIKKESEDAIEGMNEGRKKAVEEAKIWQERFLRLKHEQDSSCNSNSENNYDKERDGLVFLKKENELLQKQIESQKSEINLLRNQLLNSPSTSLATTPMKNSNTSNDPYTEDKTSTIANSPKSPAPPAVLSELNRTRVKLSESERHNRQLQHTITDLQSKANQYVSLREKGLHDKVKIEKLEREIKNIRREREMHKLIERRWAEFRQELIKLNLPLSSSTTTSTSSLSTSNENNRKNINDDENIPPEIHSIIRHFHNLTNQIEKLQSDKISVDTKLQSSKRHIQSLEQSKIQLQSQLDKIINEKESIHELYVKVNKDYKMIKSQEEIWKRENESMRKLIDSYELMEQRLSKRKSVNSVGNDVGDDDSGDKKTTDSKSNNALQLSLKSANEEIHLLKTRYENMKDENNKLEEETKSSKEELTRVKKKFEQLRDALYKEREKAEHAEKRAFEAETLSGKGSFNVNTTRVLHLSNNPTSVAIQEKYQNEIKTLKEELQSFKGDESAAKGSNSSKMKSQISALDAQKLHKRLKESFRAQIAHFREGVYLLTGYKIDMISECDRPKFKVRSMYAESESDVLEFIWPDLQDGKSAISLDMLNTKMGEALSREPCFKYIEKYGSLPAFLASVCLSLFEKQTMIG